MPLNPIPQTLETQNSQTQPKKTKQNKTGKRNDNNKFEGNIDNLYDT
jgi:hypothetical protein